MRASAAYGVADRKVFVADSFAGLPEPDAANPADAGDQHHTFTYLAVCEEVENNFRHYGLLDEQVVFSSRGWFKDTSSRCAHREAGGAAVGLGYVFLHHGRAARSLCQAGAGRFLHH